MAQWPGPDALVQRRPEAPCTPARSVAAAIPSDEIAKPAITACPAFAPFTAWIGLPSPNRLLWLLEWRQRVSESELYSRSSQHHLILFTIISRSGSVQGSTCSRAVQVQIPAYLDLTMY